MLVILVLQVRDVPRYYDDGVKRDKSSLLAKWQEDFFNLLNGEQRSDPAEASELHALGQGERPHSTMLTRPLELRQVQQAVNTAKNGISAGFEGIPIEVLCNPTAIEFLHQLLSLCFEKGQVPDVE